MSDTSDNDSTSDSGNRDQAIELMTGILTDAGMPADLAPDAAADLVDMSIRMRASDGPDQ